MKMNKEVWATIPGYENFYEVSNFGRVRSLDRCIFTKKCLKRKIRGKVLKSIKNNHGYYQVSLNDVIGRTRVKMIHKLVITRFIPNKKDLPQANHIDGDKSNNNATNLEWCTQSENMKHAYKTGLQKPISRDKNKLSKLTEKQVLEIRSKYVPWKYSLNKLAKEYRVVSSTIHSIL